MKASDQAIQSVKIFQHATKFHESDHRLRDSIRDKPELLPLVDHPALVLSAFASELYLKCLLCIETGSVPQVHNLKQLFEGLQLSTRRRLEDLWDADIRRPERQGILDYIRTRPNGQNLRLDLPYALNEGAGSFVELRYFYEKGQAFFLLHDLPDLLRRLILELFPSWASLPPIPPIGPIR